MKSIRDIKEAQEALRERHWEPLERWRVIQATITWAESQKTVQRNTAQSCLKKQAKLLMSSGVRSSRNR